MTRVVWLSTLAFVLCLGACGGGGSGAPGDGGDPGDGNPPPPAAFEGEYATVHFMGETWPTANRRGHAFLGVTTPSSGATTFNESENTDGAVTPYLQAFSYTLGSNRDLALDTTDAGEPNLHGCLSRDGKLAALMNVRSGTLPNAGVLVRRSEIFNASLDGAYDYVVFGHTTSPSDVHFSARGTFVFDGSAGTVTGFVDDLNVDSAVTNALGSMESKPFTLSPQGLVRFEFPTVIGGNLFLSGQMISGGNVIALSSGAEVGSSAAIGFAVRRSSVATATFSGTYDFVGIHWIWQSGVQDIPYNALWIEGSANGAGTWTETKRVVNHDSMVSTNTAGSTLGTGTVAPDGTFEFQGRTGAISPTGAFAVVGFFVDANPASIGVLVRR